MAWYHCQGRDQPLYGLGTHSWDPNGPDSPAELAQRAPHGQRDARDVHGDAGQDERYAGQQHDQPTNEDHEAQPGHDTMLGRPRQGYGPGRRPGRRSACPTRFVSRVTVTPSRRSSPVDVRRRSVTRRRSRRRSVRSTPATRAPTAPSSVVGVDRHLSPFPVALLQIAEHVASDADYAEPTDDDAHDEGSGDGDVRPGHGEHVLVEIARGVRCALPGSACRSLLGLQWFRRVSRRTGPQDPRHGRGRRGWTVSTPVHQSWRTLDSYGPGTLGRLKYYVREIAGGVGTIRVNGRSRGRTSAVNGDRCRNR
jgi:hypothetical protein